MKIKIPKTARKKSADKPEKKSTGKTKAKVLTMPKVTESRVKSAIKKVNAQATKKSAEKAKSKVVKTTTGVGKGNKNVPDHKIITKVKSWKLKRDELTKVGRYMLGFVKEPPKELNSVRKNFLVKARKDNKTNLASYGWLVKLLDALKPGLGIYVHYHNLIAKMLGISETMKGHTGATLAKWCDFRKGDLQKMKISNVMLSKKGKEKVMKYIADNTAFTLVLKKLKVEDV